MKLKDELPVDHHLARVYRVGSALCGLILLCFGCLGFADFLSPFSTSGDKIAGMTSNSALSVLSLVFGVALLGGAVVGGNFASSLNMTVGSLFLLSGFWHLFVLDRSANFLDFGMTNVIFSFVMGLVILTFGMYGRVSGRLPHDNPYWQRRHPEAAADASPDGRRAEAPEPTAVPEAPKAREVPEAPAPRRLTGRRRR
ncbi:MULTISPECIES: DUF4383 domain-containing protein [unclassified Streptomyces]|uniref:DUF4383 domain-containing protein n=1 Tax=unclassified Streptomyces TaxID=2593676 RepID=UPI0037FC0269